MTMADTERLFDPEPDDEISPGSLDALAGEISLRAEARASKRFATLTHATSSTNPTAASRTNSPVRESPVSCS